MLSKMDLCPSNLGFPLMFVGFSLHCLQWAREVSKPRAAWRIQKTTAFHSRGGRQWRGGSVYMVVSLFAGLRESPAFCRTQHGTCWLTSWCPTIHSFWEKESKSLPWIFLYVFFSSQCLPWYKHLNLKFARQVFGYSSLT